ncbi:hypothetical protein AMTR_s00007p00237640 [Amborella trichopoda]|uniref:Uncharacterized protein n=1 Tax=Amborella trichopoda TaxID=13333 RepID=W1PEF2_AMBTC|nr:hypothetical protein AMTR_s00007p00237640 [Amborella trichopoda]
MRTTHAVVIVLWVSLFLLFTAHGWRWRFMPRSKHIPATVNSFPVYPNNFPANLSHRKATIGARRSTSSYSTSSSSSSSSSSSRFNARNRKLRPQPIEGGEIDPRYGVEKRLVPTGPNPLHH